MLIHLAAAGDWLRPAFSVGMSVLAWTLLGLGIVGGLLGVLLPMVPGAFVLLIGAALFAWLEPGWIGGSALLALVGLTVLDRIVDFAATAFGSKWFGGSRWGMIGAVAGGLVGLFFGIVGLLIGPVIGAVALELAVAKRRPKEAARSGVGAGVGFGLSIVGRFAVCVAMIGVVAMDLFWWR